MVCIDLIFVVMNPFIGIKIIKKAIPARVAIPNCCHKRINAKTICKGADHKVLTDEKINKSLRID